VGRKTESLVTIRSLAQTVNEKTKGQMRMLGVKSTSKKFAVLTDVARKGFAASSLLSIVR